MHYRFSYCSEVYAENIQHLDINFPVVVLPNLRLDQKQF